MSPSTKNLKEEPHWPDVVANHVTIINFHTIQLNKAIDAKDKKQQAACQKSIEDAFGELEKYIASLLSSELSLAIKGVREAMRGAYIGVDEKPEFILEEILRVFDSKAKEILGESS